MKKALIALAVLGSIGGSAVAQSSVTLFGIVDAAVRHTSSSGNSLNRLDSSGLGTSRFGVRGTEDLGGGLKASFWLESEVGTDIGAGGTGSSAFWQRRSTVSLIGGFGEVRLGRFKPATRLHIEDFDPYVTTGLGNITPIFQNTLNSGATTFVRADNMITYETPNSLGGFYAAGDMSAGEGGGGDGNKLKDFRLGYKQGPLHVSGAYSETGIGSKFKVSSFGASYQFKSVKPAVLYTTTKAGAAELKALMVAVTVKVGQQGRVQASFTDSKANDAASRLTGAGSVVDDAKLFAVGYIYDLSKRTALYTTFAEIDNDGRAAYAVVGSPAVRAGRKSTGYDVGIRHSF